MSGIARISNKKISGMTLVELLMALAVASLVFAVIGRLTLFAARSYLALANYSDLDKASQNALDTMSREIRQTKKLYVYGTNGGGQSLTFVDWDGGQLTYAWDPTSRNLVRKKTGQADKILLQQCDSLIFNLSSRNPSNNFAFYPASGTNTAKLVDVTWTCSRKILQAKVNTESVQTAKIVLRN